MAVAEEVKELSMADINKFTTKEVLNKVLLDSSGDAVAAFSHTTQEALNAVLDSANSRLNVAIVGGTISGDVTITGDLTVQGTGGGYAYTEVITGDVSITRNLASASTSTPVLLITQDHAGDDQSALTIDQDGTAAVALTIDTEATTAYGMHFNNPAQTTGSILAIVEAVGLTTGSMIKAVSSSASTGIRNLVDISNTNVASTGATVMSLSNVSPSKILFADHNIPATAVAASNATAMHLDFDRTVPNSGTAAHNDIGIDLDVTSASLGTSTVKGMDIDVVGAASGNSTATGLDVSVSGADTNYAAIFSGGNVGIGTSSPSQPLHIKVDNNNTDPYFFLENANNVGRSHARFWNSSRNTYWSFGQDIDDSFKIGNSAHMSVVGSIKLLLDANSRISLSNNDTGVSNTIFGKTAGDPDGAGDQNVFIGELAAGAGTQTDDADNNVGIGWSALTAITTGASNVAIGSSALAAVVGGDDNVAVGQNALSAATVTSKNTAIGTGALSGLDKGSGGTQYTSGNIGIGHNALVGGVPASGSFVFNIAIGNDALNSTGTSAGITGTIAIGASALTALTTGANNIAIGYQAMLEDAESDSNVVIGYEAAFNTNNQNMDENVFIGKRSGGGQWAGIGRFNVAVGKDSMSGGISGADNNVALGHSALAAVVGGDNNVAVGSGAAKAILRGVDNVAIGMNAMTALAGDVADNGGIRNIAIGREAMGAVNPGTHDSALADDNIAIGYQALKGASFVGEDKDLKNNIAIGTYALTSTGTNAQNGTVAIGYSALIALTSGAANTAIGYQAAAELSDNSHNTVVGYQAMYRSGATTYYNTFIGSQSGSGDWATSPHSNTAVGAATMTGVMTDAAIGNVAVGRDSLYAVTSGASNTAVGYLAGNAITTGGNNTAIGKSAMSDMIAGAYNIAIGSLAMADYKGDDGNNAGSKNIAIGASAMETFQGGTGNVHADTRFDRNIALGYNSFRGADFNNASVVVTDNIAIGDEALNSTGVNPQLGTIAIGSNALTSLTSGSANTAIGYKAAWKATTAASSTAVGNFALGGAAASALTGNNNTAIGRNALADAYDNATNNTAVGNQCLEEVTNGKYNTAIGAYAGDVLTTGENNTYLGYYALAESATEKYAVRIGQHGIIKYKTARVSITKAHSGVNSVIAEVCKIPALSIIHRVTCTIITKSTDTNPYTLNLQLSTSSGTAADGALANASTTITVPEILGADGVATYAQNSATVLGTDSDILAGTDGANNTVYTSMPTTTIVGTADTFLYICNAVDNDTGDSSAVVLDICVEYQGTD